MKGIYILIQKGWKEKKKTNLREIRKPIRNRKGRKIPLLIGLGH